MVRLWHIAAWPLVVKVPVLVAGLMVTVAVTTSQVVLWRFAQDQKSHLELLTGAYLDGLSAAVLPALVRRDVRGVFDALDRAQGNRYADDFEPRFAILELPNRTIVASSDPRRFPVQSVVPEELRRRFAAGDGLEIDPNTDSAWLARTLRTEGSLVGRLFAEVDIAASLRVRREILITLVLVNGCLTLAFALGGYFVRKRMLRDAMANRPFLEGLRRGTAGRLANLATWIVIGLLLVALFNLFQTSSSRGPQSTLAFSDFLNDVNRGQVSDVTIQGNNINGRFTDSRAFTTYIPNNPDLVNRLTEKNVRISAAPVDENVSSLFGVLISWFLMLLLIGVWIFFMRRIFRWTQGPPRSGTAPTVDNFRKNPLFRWCLIIALTFSGLIVALQIFPSRGRPQFTLAFSDFLNDVSRGQVADVTIQGNNISGHFTDNRAFMTYIPNNPDLVNRLTEKNVRVSAAPAE